MQVARRLTDGSRRETKVPSPADLKLRAKPNLLFRGARFFVLKPLCHTLFRVKVEGKEFLPEGQFAFVANHSGPWDPVFLIHALPSTPQVHFLGDPTSTLRARTPKNKKPLSLIKAAGGRFFWWFMKHGGGIIPVDRTITGGNLAVRERLDEAVDEGCVTGGFPERTHAWRYFEGADGLLNFTGKGPYHAAAKMGLPVVPITISGAQRVWFRKKIIVSISKPFDSTRMTVDEMLEATRPVIASRLVRNVPCRRLGLARFHLLEKRLNPGPPKGLPSRTIPEYYPNGGSKPVTTEYRPRNLALSR